MDKNFFLAIAFSILVYVGWFAYMDRYHPMPRPAVQASSATAAGASPSPAREAALPAAPPAGKTSAANLSSLPLPTGELSFASYGAALESFRFKGPLSAVELVPVDAPGFFATWPGVNFVKTTQTESSISFEGRHPSGVVLTKTYRFDPQGGWNKLTLTLKNPGKKPAETGPLFVQVGPGLGTVEGDQKRNASMFRALEYLPKGGVEQVKPGKEAAAGWTWAGLDNRYFLCALRPDSGAFSSMTVVAVERSVDGKTVKDGPMVALGAEQAALAPGESRTLSADFYFGPKDLGRLKALGGGLEESVNFGYFNAIGKIVYRSLKALDRLTGNYGWSIILLTLIIQGLMFPLTYKSLQANAAMKKLQPQMQELQKRYKDDPSRLNVEMMQLYKRSGTNPLGGCLPLLLQMPVFLALYNTLGNSWELHGARFMLWVKDLSSHDPYYVLPLMMGGVMFLQQKSAPAAPDPQQAQMMQFMPIIMTFMFLNFPAGLVLYWMTNSATNLALQTALKNRLQG